MDREAGQRTWTRELARPFALGLMTCVLAGPAFAVDGVIEINQARAIAGSVTPGDFAGFPVSINSSGAYRLTSDLRPPSGFDASDVNADDVTIDLNGFNIVGVGGGIADGISLTNHQNVELRNGTIRGFTRDGVFTNATSANVRLLDLRLIGNSILGADLQGSGYLVDRCTALSNPNGGIRVGEGSLVTRCVIRGSTSFGLFLGTTSGYVGNVLTGNNGGDSFPQASGGLQLGTNVCGSDTVCP